jgi:arsenate reductase
VSGQQTPVLVLFACVQNAGRSQMAAAFFNEWADPARARAMSAGTAPADAIHPIVVDVMREVGLDLAGARPERLTDQVARSVNRLVTMGCGESCPVVPGVAYEDWPIDDPAGRPLQEVRSIRETIARRVRDLVEQEGWSG